jgi:hypothetical protein
MKNPCKSDTFVHFLLSHKTLSVQNDVQNIDTPCSVATERLPSGCLFFRYNRLQPAGRVARRSVVPARCLIRYRIEHSTEDERIQACGRVQPSPQPQSYDLWSVRASTAPITNALALR